MKFLCFRHFRGDVFWGGGGWNTATVKKMYGNQVSVNEQTWCDRFMLISNTEVIQV